MCSDKTLASKEELFDFDSAVLTLPEALIDFLSFHFTDDHNFCYWYWTKVRTTLPTPSVGFAQIVFPPFPPISMLFVFESRARGHFPDRSSHQQTRALHNIDIGGRGKTVNSFCLFHFDTCLSFVSLSGVVRTFVCYLSGLKFVFRLLVPFHDVLPWTRFWSLGLLQRLCTEFPLGSSLSPSSGHEASSCCTTHPNTP